MPDAPTPASAVSPAGALPYPVASPLKPEALEWVPDAARTWLQKGQQEAADLMPQLGTNAFMGPVLIPEDPLQFQKDWVNWMEIAPGQRLAGYLGMAGNLTVDDQPAEILVTLLVDYRIVCFRPL